MFDAKYYNVLKSTGNSSTGVIRKVDLHRSEVDVPSENVRSVLVL